jgi:hypothetical protein
MNMEFGLTDDDLVNTKYAPLAALAVHYQQNLTLRPLEGVQIPMKERDFSPASKLTQILLSILGGCVTLSEVNVKLREEHGLAKVWRWERFADQSSLSRTLDALTLKQIDELREAVTLIWRNTGQTLQHDWRGHLWLDFDLSGLPCSKQAEESQKGYFSGKKTRPAASWHGSAPSSTGKRSGQICSQATDTQSVAFKQQCWPLKML